MVMNDDERLELGRRIKARREHVFNQKKAAYVAAKINSATWSKAEAGESIRDDNLRTIIRTLWPETGGDWTLVPVGGPGQDRGYVAAPGPLAEPGITNEDLMREILRSRAEADQIEASVRALSDRVTRLESATEPLDRAGGSD